MASIETTGPERYEFQYHVTLELILRLWGSQVEAVVDSGGEDATIFVQAGSKRWEIELQVKGAQQFKQAVDEHVLRKYLAHYPSRRSSNCLLERLIASSDRLVLFVCAQRAMDFAAPLTVRGDWRGSPHASAPLSLTAAEQFLKAARSTTASSERQLEKDRAAAFASFSRSLDKATLATAFQRLLIQDRVTKSEVIARLRDHLRDLKVPSDRTDTTLLAMLQAVRDSKGSAQDVVPELERLLEQQVVPQIEPRVYLERGYEQAWVEQLSRDKALLLSGPPRCGKTDTARWIASKLQAQGYDVQTVSLVDEAERILSDARRQSVLVVLDDPLGADFEASFRRNQELRSLERLIRDIGPNRRLIVSQSQEALLATCAASTLDAALTSGLAWQDLGSYPEGFLTRTWELQAERNGVPPAIKTALASAIEARELDVAPGVLTHLAAYHVRLIGADPVRLAQGLASESARDYAATLKASKAVHVVRALAIGSSAAECSSDRELAFILGDQDEFPLPDTNGIVMRLGAESDAPKPPPFYGTDPQLSTEAKAAIGNLEAHQVIRRNRPKHFEFAHPYYRAAARATVKLSTSIERDEILTFIRRGLFAPVRETSAATARNLRWLREDLKGTLDLDSELVDLAEIGLRWHFPTTRDLCYEFLQEVSSDEPDAYLSKVQDWVNMVNSVEIDEVEWDNGEPYFPDPETLVPSFLRQEKPTDGPRVQGTLQQLASGDLLPEPFRAVELLRHYRGTKDELDAAVLSRLLSYPHGLIRAEAATVWLSVPRSNDGDVLKRIERDTHPNVVSQALQAIIGVWPMVDRERKDSMVNLLRVVSEQPETAAIVVLGVLSHFTSNDDDWGGDAGEKPWELVGEVLPSALRRFPIQFRMSEHRLYGVCDVALSHVGACASADIVNGWVDWLGRRIDGDSLPDDYSLGVASATIDAPHMTPSDRIAAFRRMFALQSTGAVLIFVASLTCRWDRLSDDERALLLDVVTEDREDLVWIQAAALTHEHVPGPVQERIFGNSELLNIAPETMIEAISPSLLAACVRMHRGSPQPLWYLGHHHDDSPTWIGVIQHLAGRPDHPLFEECFEEVAARVDRYGISALLGAVRSVGAEHVERVFAVLLRCKVQDISKSNQEAFDLVLEMAVDATLRKRMVAQIVDASDVVVEELHHIREWTENPEARFELEIAFKNDYFILSVLSALNHVGIENFSPQRALFTDFLVKMVGVCPPKLSKTYDAVSRVLRDIGAQDSHVSTVEGARKAYLRARWERRIARLHQPERDLPMWIGPRSA